MTRIFLALILLALISFKSYAQVTTVSLDTMPEIQKWFADSSKQKLLHSSDTESGAWMIRESDTAVYNASKKYSHTMYVGTDTSFECMCRSYIRYEYYVGEQNEFLAITKVIGGTMEIFYDFDADGKIDQQIISGQAMDEKNSDEAKYLALLNWLIIH